MATESNLSDDSETVDLLVTGEGTGELVKITTENSHKYVTTVNGIKHVVNS